MRLTNSEFVYQNVNFWGRYDNKGTHEGDKVVMILTANLSSHSAQSPMGLGEYSGLSEPVQVFLYLITFILL